MDIKETILEMGRKARAASLALANLPAEKKNAVLHAMAKGLLAAESDILKGNANDLDAGRERGLSSALLDRLKLTPERLRGMADGIRKVAGLPDPVGEVLAEWTRPNGLRIRKERVPIGVIGIIYESRPNVTSDAAVLCFKAGNATILRGGSEAIHSNRAIADALQSGGESAGLPADSIQLIPITDRESVRHLAEMDQFLDLIVPRGGHGLIEAVVSLARMPVIKHYNGICHVYVDRDADLDEAHRIVIDAKCQRPGVCNALESLLVHRDVAGEFYRRTGSALQERGVEIRGGDDVRDALGSAVAPVTEEDWSEEYLALILSVKTVDSIDQAVAHINRYGSRHSDAIVTANAESAEKFLNEVDSATVYWNASTRFTDGEEFGFGAEIGISTDKLHARGPMALPELTSYKYKLFGTGQVKDPGAFE